VRERAAPPRHRRQLLVALLIVAAGAIPGTIADHRNAPNPTPAGAPLPLIGADGVAAGLPATGTIAGARCSPTGARSFAVAPLAVAADNDGGLYVSDSIHAVVCHVDRSGHVTVVAGNGATGYTGDGMRAIYAELYLPSSLAVTPAGDLLIADRWNNRVRRVERTSGVITSIAGTGVAGDAGDGGPADAAQLSFPTGVAVDRSSNVYIADSKNNRVRRIDARTKTITTIAGTGLAGFGGDGGPALSAPLDLPVAVAVDDQDEIYVADALNNRIRRISRDGIVTTVAGTGLGGSSGDGAPATEAHLSQPLGVAITPTGFAIADSSNHRVRVVDRAGVISTLAGVGTAGFSGDGGPGVEAELAFPVSVAWDPQRGLLVADSNNHRVRAISQQGDITTVAGNGLAAHSGDGEGAAAAELYEPIGVATTPDDAVIVADSLNHVVRRIGPDLTIQTIAGTPGVAGYHGDGGPAVDAALEFPTGVAVGGDGSVYIADVGNDAVRRVAPDGTITTVAGTGTSGSDGDGGPASTARLSGPSGVAVDRDGTLYVADTGNNRVRRIGPDGTITTIAGDGRAGMDGDGGPGVAARLHGPAGVAVSGHTLVIADVENNRVRALDLDTGLLTTVAGSGDVGYSPERTPATESRLDHPTGVAMASNGDVYIADKGNCLVRRVSASGRDAGLLITLVGWTPVRGLAPVCEFGDAGAPPRWGTTLNSPTGVALTSRGTIVVADSLSHRVRSFTVL
jgi:sugar lactone lactonase YvrE